MNVSSFNTQKSHGHIISSNLDLDPLFINSISDYHLKDGSPAINSGVTPKSNMDFEGNSVPFENTKPDIGIYEHGISQTNDSSSIPATVTADAGKDQTICAGRVLL